MAAAKTPTTVDRWGGGEWVGGWLVEKEDDADGGKNEFRNGYLI